MDSSNEDWLATQLLAAVVYAAAGHSVTVTLDVACKLPRMLLDRTIHPDGSVTFTAMVKE